MRRVFGTWVPSSVGSSVVDVSVLSLVCRRRLSLFPSVVSVLFHDFASVEVEVEVNILQQLRSK